MMKRTLLVLTAAALTLAGCYTNPVTGRKSLVLLSQGEELTLGAESFAEVRQKEKISGDAAANARVQRVGQRIAQAVGSELPDAKWEFVVFESKDVNAFALPGGKVGVYTGLLQLAENDAELATVMGHEIGHVIARHGAERMSEAVVLQGVGQLAATAVEAKTDPQKRQLFETAYGGAATLGRVLPHSRANESEADRMGATYAARAGYDPRAAISFWKKMMAHSQSTAKAGAPTGGRLGELLSTHPTDQKRIQDLQAMMPSVVPLYEQNRNKGP
ncbi:MAG TPA: M48 family metallopeptidase [Opitutaceae bacterium]|nr:M48 family metallopeptidase [Opitutaceae bacterium]